MEEKWMAGLAELEKKRAEVLAAGGPERKERQHAAGKLTARERLDALFDAGTFAEIGDMAVSRATDFGMEQKKRPGDGVVAGWGKIHGRMVFAAAQDFTVCGGSLGEVQAQRICRVMDLAYDLRAPYIAINDSGGARIEEGVEGLSGYADIFRRNTRASGVIPQISVILGPCAGGACYSPAISDFIFMTAKTSQMYITGPAVVASVTGEEITADALGGAAVHRTQSGVAHFVYPDDRACLAGVRDLLAYLPRHCGERPLSKEPVPPHPADLCGLVPANPRKPYDVHGVIDAIADADSFFEVQPDFAPNLVVGFARLAGETVGVVANQSRSLAGSLEINAADKGARFIRFCDCFNIPLLTLVDVPAFLPGSRQEHGGIIRHGAKLLYAYSEATVPKVGLILRKAYGGAYIAMNSKGTGADVVYAWPIAEIAVMGAAGAVSIIGKKEIAAAADPAAKREELTQAYNERFMNPYIAAARGFVDAVIRPEESREKILAAFEMLRSKRLPTNEKKHGNIPL